MTRDADGSAGARSTEGQERWIRWAGAAAVVGSVLFVVSLCIQAFVSQPDSHQFSPGLTSPQFLRDTLAPGLTVTALMTHLAGLLAVRRRDGSRWQDGTHPRLATVGWVGLTIGVALTLVGYGGLFTVGQGTDALAALAGAGFALLALLGIGVLGVGAGVWSITLVQTSERRRLRAVGWLLLSLPVVGVAGTLVELGSASTFVPLPYAVGFAMLGYDCWARPSR